MKYNKRKRVYTGIETGVNYVTHIYTLAEAGFKDENYISQYEETISKEDIKYLRAHSDYMSFVRREHGLFAGQLYFIPSYFNMKTKKDYEDYFHAWDQAIKQKSALPVEKYRCYNYDYREMFKAGKERWDKILEITPVFNRIGEIYINNIDNYCNNIWPEIKPVLLKKSRELNKKIEDDLIKKWERVTGSGFKKDEYYLVLFYAGANGPSFNNLSLDKNTAFYDYDEGYMLDMLSHELGVHILLPDLKKSISKYEREIPRIDDPDIYGNVSYMAFESLASFYNMKVLNRDTRDIDSFIDFKKFFNIYSKLYQLNKEPLRLYNDGIKEYINEKTGSEADEV